MRISVAGACLIVFQCGCAAVDVRPEVSKFSTSVAEATQPLAADLALRTAEEEAAARARAIASGAEVYGPPTDCALAVALTPGTGLQDCTLKPVNPAPVSAGSAKAMLGYTNVLTAYAEALTLLATSDAPDRVGQAFGGFLTSVQELAAVVPAFGDTASTLSRVNPPLTKLGSRLAEAQRMRLIRRLVSDAEPGIEEVLDRLIAYRDADDGLSAGAEELNAAYDRMETARRSGNAGAYGAAVTVYEASHADLRNRLGTSDAGRLILIREAQRALAIRLSAPGDLDSYVDLIETLKALSDALSQ